MNVTTSRFVVSPFATKRFGESPDFGWRVVDTSVPCLLATFDTEAAASRAAETLNEHACSRKQVAS